MKLFGSFLGAVLAAVVILLIVAGGPAVFWYDRHFRGWSSSFGPKLPFVHCCVVRVGLPPGIALADADTIHDLSNRLKVEAGNVTTLSTALDQQSTLILAHSAEGRALLAETGSYEADYRRAGRAESAALALAQPMAGDGVCARAVAQDARFVDQLKQGGL